MGIYYINPVIIALFDNNLLIIHQDGVDVCDPELNLIKESLIFETSEEQITKNDLSKITIAKFYDENIIIAIIKEKLFIFDKKGNCLIEKGTMDIKNQHPSFYTLAPFKDGNDYYFYSN